MALHSLSPAGQPDGQHDGSSSRSGLEALRERVRRIERGEQAGPRACLPLGPAELDEALPGGGLALAGLHEILPQRAEWDDGPATGFCLALAARILAAGKPPGTPDGTPDETPGGRLLWVSQAGDLHAPALAAAGIAPERLLEVRVRNRTDALWTLEEALRCAELALVVGEIDELDALAARRLQLAAESAGRPCLLLHRPRLAGRGARLASPALTRWRIAAAPSESTQPGARDLVGHPRWRVSLERCRGGRPADFLLEWHDEHSTWNEPREDEPRGEDAGNGPGDGGRAVRGARRRPPGALSLAAGLRDRAGARRPEPGRVAG